MNLKRTDKRKDAMKKKSVLPVMKAKGITAMQFGQIPVMVVSTYP